MTKSERKVLAEAPDPDKILPSRTGKKGKANSLDLHLGSRLRQRRSVLGMSQEKLAEAVGLTFQQVQKYERGANRISASRLFEFAGILGVNTDFFYPEETQLRTHGLSDNEQAEFINDGQLYNKESLELLRAYYSVHDEKKRKNLLNVIRSMAESMK